MAAPKIYASDFNQACNTYVGWCTECQEFTRDSTEPDAEDYLCPSCDSYTVMGAEQALLCGEIELEE